MFVIMCIVYKRSLFVMIKNSKRNLFSCKQITLILGSVLAFVYLGICFKQILIF